MHIGFLKAREIGFTHKGTDVSLNPSVSQDGIHTWLWDNVYDTAIDAHYELEGECFVGAVSVEISEQSVTAVEVLVDGNICGAHRAETGKMIGGSIDIPVGVRGSLVTVRLFSNLKTIILTRVEILGAQDDGAPLVYPTPKSIEYLDGYVKIKDVVSKNGDADEIYAAEFLKERLTETLGDWKSSRGTVIVFDKRDAKSYDGERYTVKTTRGRMTVSAKTRLTLLYGADTVLQLSDIKKGVRKFNCDDRPSKSLRGFHAGLPSRDQFAFMRRLFRYVLLPLRYNTFFVELAGGMRYKSHPEITEAWRRVVEEYEHGLMPKPPHMGMLANGEILEQEEVVRYIGFARELGFEIVPEVQSLGHVQYITIAHPELAEIEDKVIVVDDTRTEDARPASKFFHCYCPSMEESYRIILDIIDEVIDVIKPDRYVHIGHDEVYQIGVCKRCRDKDPAEIFAEHVNRLHDHLAARGLGTMMWSDMLQPPPARPYATYRAIDKLAKDIVMLDFVWYFNIPLDIEDHLLEKGYRVAVGNLYSSHYPRYKSRMMKKNMIGGELSTWLENSEESYAGNGKIWDAMHLSEMLWNIEDYDARNKRTYNDIFARYLQPRMRDCIREKYNPKGYNSTSIKLPHGKPAPDELRKICPKAICTAGERIAVEAKFERLVFEHATLHSAPRIMWKPIEKIGDYILSYADGTTVEIPVKYAQNIMVYDTAYGEAMPQEYYRHNGYVGTWFSDPGYCGKTATGGDMTVSGFVWENPTPEKVIAEIVYKPVENDSCGLILAGIHGLNRR